MHKTNCWHKVTQHAEQGLVGRQEESIPPSLHLSIGIPGSPLYASGFCNYNQTAASRPPKHWLTAWINQDVERPWDAVCLFMCVCVPVSQLSVHLCVYTTSLCMCSMFRCQKLMCEFLCLCLFLSISRFYLYICVCTVLMWSVGLSDREGVCMECSISMTTSLNNNAITHFN